MRPVGSGNRRNEEDRYGPGEPARVPPLGRPHRRRGLRPPRPRVVRRGERGAAGGPGRRGAHGPDRLSVAQLRRPLRAPGLRQGRCRHPHRRRRPSDRHGRRSPAQGLCPGPGLQAPSVSPRPAEISHETRRPQRDGAFRADLVGRGLRPRRPGDPPGQREIRQRRPLRALRDGRLQPADRAPDRPEAPQLRRGLARLLQQLFLGLHFGRDADRLRDGDHREPAAGLAQHQILPDVGLESGRDARRDEQRIFRPAGPGARRPHGLRRPAHDDERRVSRRRVGAHPPRDGHGHDVGHGLRHDHRRPRRQGLHRDALRRVRRGPDAPGMRGRRKLRGLHPREARRGRQDAGLGRADHRGPAGDDRPHRPRIRDGQAGGPLPGIRDAEAGLRRAGGPGRLRPGGDHRQRRRPRRLGGRHRPPGAGRRAFVDRLSRGRQSRQGRDPELPLDGGRRPGQGHGPRRRRRGRRSSRHGHQAHLGRGQQLPRQPARQRQPDGAHSRATRSASNASSSRTTS